ncbi:MAG: DUF1800 family protein [Gammaproteobacteria bacterium]|nr:DUF1800 family protein [Gammaproteobacteria bacterium]
MRKKYIYRKGGERPPLLSCWLLFLALAIPGASYALDTDGDGVDDNVDNCINHSNAQQRDTDSDGFGNRCDPDLNGDQVVNFADLGLLKSVWGTSDANGDLNGDGAVNFTDLGLMKSFWGQAPGPAGPGETLSQAQAARFLAQATFGPTRQDIEALVQMGDLEAWIDAQLSAPTGLLLPNAKFIYQANYQHCIQDPPSWGCPTPFNELVTAGQDGVFDTSSDQFRHVWWWNVIDGQDQLRQRVTFALSQILVISDLPDALANSGFAVADYYDTLAQHAFGNYRDLLEAVTLHPMMGIYLSHAQNEKADPSRNIRPDENYARELLQLFTLGVHELHPDGTEIGDSQGQPIATYDQFDIQEFARIFTGWNFAGLTWGDWHQRADNTKDMEANPSYHDTGEKLLLNNGSVAAGQSALQDLRGALDNIFAHPNLAPFVSRLLIQRLVTSNPTPAYIGRVASVFNDNGAGERGDLSAVVKAILLDPEARTGHTNVANFGKPREPLLAISHLWRAFNAAKINGGDWDIPPSVAVYASYGAWSGLRWFENDIGQNVLRSPSVFNFYSPNYAPQGALRTAGLVAPEFQIATESNVMGLSNTINRHIQDLDASDNWSYLNLQYEQSLAADIPALLDHLDLVMLSGAMPPGMRTIIENHLNTASFSSGAQGQLAKVRDAISLIINSPEYLVQK